MDQARPIPGGDGAGEPELKLDGRFQQVRRIIAGVDLDCNCRSALDEALERFSELETAQARRTALRSGRRTKAAIAAVLDLLSDLDDISAAEADRSAYGEFADLFDTIAAEAARGARLMRQLEAI